jgi:hypothetical protein
MEKVKIISHGTGYVVNFKQVFCADELMAALYFPTVLIVA